MRRSGRLVERRRSWLGGLKVLDTLIMGMLVASALLAFAVRRNAVACLAALALLPAIPAVLRYLLQDAAVVPAGTDTTAMYVMLWAVNYGAVWGGFAAGLIFNLLDQKRSDAGRIDTAPSRSPERQSVSAASGGALEEQGNSP